MATVYSRKEFLSVSGLLTAGSLIATQFTPGVAIQPFIKKGNLSISVSTDFLSGGGRIEISNENPIVLTVNAHKENSDAWSQLWWYFLVEGLEHGDTVTIDLRVSDQSYSGITEKVFFSYDQLVWALTDTGSRSERNGDYYQTYTLKVKSNIVWFAYDLPYTSDSLHKLIRDHIHDTTNVEVISLSKSKNGRDVQGLKIHNHHQSEPKYGIWLQARTHAFESGTSWVLNELVEWLVSNDPLAKALLECSMIYVFPIIDMDGVDEGRSGKNRLPYDHNRGWALDVSEWEETNQSKTLMRLMVDEDQFDLFIDFHGPGSDSSPYFIVPESSTLPHNKQSVNRSAFFNVLGAKPIEHNLLKKQSMTNFFYSERFWDSTVLNSRDWVLKHTNDRVVALTMEINMNTPLSTVEGYKEEAITLGRAIARYFTENHHLK